MLKRDKQSGNFGKGVQSNLKQTEKDKGYGILGRSIIIYKIN